MRLLLVLLLMITSGCAGLHIYAPKEDSYKLPGIAESDGRAPRHFVTCKYIFRSGCQPVDLPEAINPVSLAQAWGAPDEVTTAGEEVTYVYSGGPLVFAGAGAQLVIPLGIGIPVGRHKFKFTFYENDLKELRMTHTQHYGFVCGPFVILSDPDGKRETKFIFPFCLAGRDIYQ